jgi:hypothetical protein
MLLLVVGLVVLVLVIVVVVFLSVRSMRADDDAYPIRQGRDTFGRDSARSSGRAPDGQGSVSQGRASRSSAGQGRAQRGGRRAAPEPAPVPGGYDDYQPASLPRPRGAQHDQDLADDRREPARRRPRQAPVPAPARVAADGRDSAAGEWSDTDWGGVSDEQYWAELSSDKPLATTARSAAPVIGAGRDGGHADPGDRGDRGAAAGPDLPVRREPGRSLAGAAAGLRRRPTGGGEAVPFRDETFSNGRSDAPPDTDPGLGRTSGWSGSDDAGTASWSTEEATRWAGNEPAHAGWDEQEQATASWSTQALPTRRGAGHDDPLTSPSFSAQEGYGTDARSYRDSHDRPQAHSGSSVWDTHRTAAAPGYDDGYDRQVPYGGSSSRLEPLPEPGGASNSWHSASVPADSQPSYPEPASRGSASPGSASQGSASQGWDQAGSRYQEASPYHDAPRSQTSGYGYGDQDAYTDPGQQAWSGADRQDWNTAEPAGQEYQSWRGAEPGYGRASGYGEQAGYPQAGEAGYGQAAYGQAESGYGQTEAGYSPRGRHGQRTGQGYSPGYDR